MIVIGHDTDGVTDVSLKALKALSGGGLKLEKVYIDAASPSTCITSFIFSGQVKAERVYNATGFSIGYGGRGPHGLWEAIRYFHPDGLEEDFWDTEIPYLTFDSNWEWTKEKGFKKI